MRASSARKNRLTVRTLLIVDQMRCYLSGGPLTIHCRHSDRQRPAVPYHSDATTQMVEPETVRQPGTIPLFRPRAVIDPGIYKLRVALLDARSISRNSPLRGFKTNDNPEPRPRQRHIRRRIGSSVTLSFTGAPREARGSFLRFTFSVSTTNKLFLPGGVVFVSVQT